MFRGGSARALCPGDAGARVATTIAPGGRATLTIGTVRKGEFAFRIRASSDGVKRFTLTHKRNGGDRPLGVTLTVTHRRVPNAG